MLLEWSCHASAARPFNAAHPIDVLHSPGPPAALLLPLLRLQQQRDVLEIVTADFQRHRSTARAVWQRRSHHRAAAGGDGGWPAAGVPWGCRLLRSMVGFVGSFRSWWQPAEEAGRPERGSAWQAARGASHARRRFRSLITEVVVPELRC